MLVSEFFYYIILQKNHCNFDLSGQSLCMKARASERCESSRRRFSPRSKLEEEKLPRPRLEIIFQKNISTWISGEHEAGDDEEQEQLD